MRPIGHASLVLALLAGCLRGEPFPPSEPPPPASVAPAPGSSLPAPTPDASECAHDQDCLLLPWVACCGECPPAPPFDVGPVEALDAILIEAEQRCAEDTRPCEATPACDPAPATCTARAACVDGRCAVLEDGCGTAVI